MKMISAPLTFDEGSEKKEVMHRNSNSKLNSETTDVASNVMRY